MKHLIRCITSVTLLLIFTLLIQPLSWAQDIDLSSLASITTTLTSQHPGKSGAFVLEKGEDSLLTRAWLTDNATKSIDVQYFIWSTDNIGILAAEAHTP